MVTITKRNLMLGKSCNFAIQIFFLYDKVMQLRNSIRKHKVNNN